MPTSSIIFKCFNDIINHLEINIVSLNKYKLWHKVLFN